MPSNSKESGRRPGIRRWLHLFFPFVLLLAVPTLLLSRPELVERIQNNVFDVYQRLHPRAYEEVPVRILDIDDESLSRLGQWPWPRTLLAKAVDRLTEFKVAAIGFDSLFPEPDRTSPKQILPLWTENTKSPGIAELASRFPDHDRLFAQAIARSHVVLGSALTAGTNNTLPLIKASFVYPSGDPLELLDRFTGAVANRPELERAAAGNGSLTYVPELDGVIRRVPLIQRHNDRLIPSLAAEALRVAQGAGTILVKCSGTHGEPDAVDKIKIGNLIVPTDAKGRMWLYFTKSVPERTISIWKIFEKNFDATALKNRIVFIGTSASGLKDQRHTPLDPITPGVEIHAQVAEQILLHHFLLRPDWAADAEAVWLVILGALLIFLLQNRGAVWGAGFSCLTILLTFVLAWRAFTRQHWLLDPLFPSLTVALIYLSFASINYIQGERERREIRNAFRYYLSPELVDRLAQHPENLRLGGEMRRMTFHFCDIEGFTSMSEFYDPKALIHFLNSLLSPLTEIILRHHGTIDKYIGDCIMAFWNAPLNDPQHAQNACLAVIDMHERLKVFNDERRSEAKAGGKEFMPLRIRTGLNSGNCMVGNMGSYQRFSYSVIGDDVNLASRLEGANKFFGTHVMASEATVSQAREAVEVRPLGQLRVAGRVVPVSVFELLARKGQLSGQWQKATPLYEQGLKEFFAREFEQAAGSFQKVLALLPEDGPSSLYLKMAADYSQIPPPESWDGVFHLTAK